MSGNKQSAQQCLMNLMFESAESVSISKDNAVSYLKEEGINVEGFVSEGMRRIKQMQLRANAAKRKNAFLGLEEVKEKARSYVKQLMEQAEFSFAAFVMQEKIPLHNRKIESFSDEDVESTLTDYFALKMSQESRSHDV
jgi:5'-3' exonuclease